MKIITIEGCKVVEQDGILHLERGNSSRPLYKLFRHYVGRWVKLDIMQSKLNGWSERSGEGYKFKIVSVNCNGEIICEYKWRKKKRHDWKCEQFNLVEETFNEYISTTDEPYVDIRISPNVKETGYRDKEKNYDL